jgi:hypothetical protein
MIIFPDGFDLGYLAVEGALELGDPVNEQRHLAAEVTCSWSMV